METVPAGLRDSARLRVGSLGETTRAARLLKMEGLRNPHSDREDGEG